MKTITHTWTFPDGSKVTATASFLDDSLGLYEITWTGPVEKLEAILGEEVPRWAVGMWFRDFLIRLPADVTHQVKEEGEWEILER